MNKTELVELIQSKLGEGATKKCAEAALSAVLTSIGEAAKKGKVQLVGFGTFEMKRRSERTGRNPQTNAPMTIPASTTLGFKPSSVFKTVEKPKCTKKCASKKSSAKK